MELVRNKIGHIAWLLLLLIEAGFVGVSDARVAGEAYGAAGVIQERSADGGVVRKTYAEGGEMDYTGGVPVARYYTRDHLGSVREVISESGAILAKYDYSPYGVRTRVAGSYEAEKGYTGHDYHASSGLVLTRYRGYDPERGRWLSPDPLGEAGGLNLYGYTNNDPINGVDPLGLATQNHALKVAAAWGVAWGAAGGLAEKGMEDASAIKTAVDCGEEDLAFDMVSPWQDYACNAGSGGFFGGLSFGAYKGGGALIGKLGARLKPSAAMTPGPPNRIYSARELVRRADEPGPFHNFPESFNREIFESGTRTTTPNYFNQARQGLSNDSIQYRLPGTVNGKDGMFEIFTRHSTSGNTEVIMHRFFNPNR